MPPDSHHMTPAQRTALQVYYSQMCYFDPKMLKYIST